MKTCSVEQAVALPQARPRYRAQPRTADAPGCPPSRRSSAGACAELNGQIDRQPAIDTRLSEERAGLHAGWDEPVVDET